MRPEQLRRRVILAVASWFVSVLEGLTPQALDTGMLLFSLGMMAFFLMGL